MGVGVTHSGKAVKAAKRRLHHSLPDLFTQPPQPSPTSNTTLINYHREVHSHKTGSYLLPSFLPMFPVIHTNTQGPTNLFIYTFQSLCLPNNNKESQQIMMSPFLPICLSDIDHRGEGLQAVKAQLPPTRGLWSAEAQKADSRTHCSVLRQDSRSEPKLAIHLSIH